MSATKTRLSTPPSREEREEARRAAQRERAAKEGAPKEGAKEKDKGTTEKTVELVLDPRVALAVQCCLESMTMDEITPEFQKKMQDAFAGAISYEIETRLPMIADEFAPEIGLGCAIIGSGVVRFRVARQKTVKATAQEKKEGEE